MLPFPDKTGHSVTAAQDEQQHEAAAAGLDEESTSLVLEGNARRLLDLPRSHP